MFMHISVCLFMSVCLCITMGPAVCVHMCLCVSCVSVRAPLSERAGGCLRPILTAPFLCFAVK